MVNALLARTGTFALKLGLGNVLSTSQTALSMPAGAVGRALLKFTESLLVGTPLTLMVEVGVTGVDEPEPPPPAVMTLVAGETVAALAVVTGAALMAS